MTAEDLERRSSVACPTIIDLRGEPMNAKLKICTVIFIAAILAMAGSPVLADDYPSKGVNYVIPFGPGGESDITARHQQPFFKKLFGQDMIISYKPGGGGAVG